MTLCHILTVQPDDPLTNRSLHTAIKHSTTPPENIKTDSSLFSASALTDDVCLSSVLRSVPFRSVFFRPNSNETISGTYTVLFPAWGSKVEQLICEGGECLQEVVPPPRDQGSDLRKTDLAVLVAVKTSLYQTHRRRWTLLTQRR
ncbi:hypothetical protein CRG98_029251 [Punica granatum]|uniref:Uncharacterized protein n=1 Tax=Punica granatum TaxID=22663 RepID=A0A2I0J2B7_PUNGR|nr:hypothetical protein CRG98_029251 [Punica granatum]